MSLNASGSVTATSLIVNGPATVTGTATYSGDLAAARVIAGGNNLVKRKFVTYQAAANEHQFNGIGTTSVGQTYQVDSVSASHTFYAGLGAGSSQQLFTIGGNGNAILTGALQAVPQYATRSKSAGQGIPDNAAQAISFVDTFNGPLTSDGVKYTNNTGRSLIILVSYTLSWEPITFGGNVRAWIQTNFGPDIWQSSAFVPTGLLFYAQTAASGIINIPNGGWIQCIGSNQAAIPADVRGDGTFMSYYLLN